MEWSRQLKALIKAAEAQGWVERRSKHYLFFPWDGETRPVVVPSTPSSRRTPANKLAELKRAGLIWPPDDAARPRRTTVQTTNDDLPWWNVHAEAVGDEQYDEILLEDLLDNLLEHDGVVTGTPEEPIDGRARYGAGFSVQAPDAVEAVARAREVFERAAASAGLPQWPLARVEAQTERELELELARPGFPDLLGVAELAERLGVSRQRAWTVTGRPDFPEPVARLKATPVWTAGSVRRFLGAWPRKAGRPSASTRQQAG